jgi:hypothetical protein
MNVNGTSVLPGPILEHIRIGLGVLLRASTYADLVSAEAAEFAVEIQQLRDVGFSEPDFRWMISQSYVTHLIEVTLPNDSTRMFRDAGVTFDSTSCFYLTPKGEELAVDLLGNGLKQRRPEWHVNDRKAEPEIEPRCELPRWDTDRQELWFHGLLVKRFRLPSLNQVTILAAFEEEGWPARIDDPLPPKPAQDSRRRLHDTVRNLNRSQRNHLLRFSGDGTGLGVLWESERDISKSDRS